MDQTSGLRTDLEELLSRFQRTETVRYEEFSAIWRDMKFSAIFNGRMKNTDRRIFTQEVLAQAHVYLFPPYKFQIRFGGLYLLYGLYNTQVCQPKVKIRMGLKDWDEVLEFQQEMLKAEHYDAVYILNKMLRDRAFHFTALPRMLSYKKPKRDDESVNEDFREKSNRVTELMTVNGLEEIVNIHKHYQRMKCMISTNKTHPDKALSLLREEFVTQLKNIATDFKQCQDHKQPRKPKNEELGGSSAEEEDNSKLETGFSRAQTLAMIKSKSYSSVPKVSRSRRHRQVELESSRPASNKGNAKKSEKHQKLPARKDNAAPPSGEGEETDFNKRRSRRCSMPVISKSPPEVSPKRSRRQ
uniref:snRNA-activating protein complex subunit 1-like protein n=1 Tax=Callorhinchus milii TaxID=7868 RepID=V9KZQ7_CALMI